MPSSLGLNLERTLERRACGQFTLRSMKVVLTLCYLACFHLFLHTWRENIFPEAAKRAKVCQNFLNGGDGEWAKIYRHPSAAPSGLQSPSAEWMGHVIQNRPPDINPRTDTLLGHVLSLLSPSLELPPLLPFLGVF